MSVAKQLDRMMSNTSRQNQGLKMLEILPTNALGDVLAHSNMLLSSDTEKDMSVGMVSTLRACKKAVNSATYSYSV